MYNLEDDNIAEPNESLTILISKASASTNLLVSFNIISADVTIVNIILLGKEHTIVRPCYNNDIIFFYHRPVSAYCDWRDACFLLLDVIVRIINNREQRDWGFPCFLITACVLP